jgi:phage-related protein
VTDYNLGNAHGTVKIDYDGSGIRQANRDVDALGQKTTETSKKVQTADAAMQSAYDSLSAAIRGLSADVDKHAASEVIAKSKVEAAEKTLQTVRSNSESTTKQIRDAEKAVQQAQTRSVESSRRLETSTRALAIARGRLNQIPVKPNASEIDKESNSFSRLLSHLANVDKQTRTASSGLNTFTGRTKLLGGAIAIATPGIAGLGVSLVALAGLAGVAAGALASVGAVAATLAVGTAGISNAFKAAAADSKSAGSAAVSSAKQQQAAAKAIEQAKRSLADAEENLKQTRVDAARAAIQAERGILQAQRDLVGAQRDALRAQENLTKARAEATRQLEDMRFALTGGALDERQAILDVQQAQEDLNRTLSDPTATERDRQQAILNLEKQQHALEQTRLENSRLATDQAAAAAKGVSGSDAVVSAQDSVNDATQRVRDAVQGVADAQDAAKQQQLDSAKAISDAVQSVTDAQDALTEAYANSAEAAAGGASKTADAMANISPNARALVQAILDQKNAWQELKFSVQDRLFAGLADDINPLAKTYLPLLKDGLGGIADGLNIIVKNIADFLRSSQATNDIRHIFENTGTAVANLSTTVRDLLAAFLDIASVGTDFLPGMAADANNAAAGFRNMISAAKESGKLHDWMQGGIDVTKTLFELLGNVASIIGTLFSAFDQEGGGALNTLTNLTGQIDKFLKSAEGQAALHALGRILASIGGAYGKVFLSFLDVAAQLLVDIEPLITAFADAAGTYLAGSLQILGAILGPIAYLLGLLGPALGPVIAGIYTMNKVVGAAKIAWGLLNGVMEMNPFILIAAAIITLALLIIQNWDAISAFLSDVWTAISTLAVTIWTAIADFFVGLWTGISSFFVSIWTGISDFFVGIWNGIRNTAVSMWNAIASFFTNAWNGLLSGVRTAFGNVIDFFKRLPGQIWDFVSSLPGKFMDLGKNIILGIVRGLGNFASAIWNKLKDIVSSAWNNVLDFFGINSPAKEGIWAGEMIGKGLAQGIAGSVGVVAKAAATLSEAVAFTAPAFDPASPSGMTFQAGTTSSTPVGLTLPATTAAVNSKGSSPTTVYVDTVNQNVTGNLDPTRPVEWRQAMVSLKDGLRQVDRDYA